MKPIELRRLRAFVTVVEEGHITRAAMRLGMQQPPLTRLLRGLEKELDVLLLHRLPRGVRATPAGEALFDEAQAVLARAEGVADTVRRAALGEQGRLRIGFTSSTALHPLVPSLVRRFRGIAPAVALILEEAGSGELIEALLHERLDAAFVRSSVAAYGELRVDPVLDEPMVAALPSDHHLASKGADALPLGDLAVEPFVLYRRHAGPGLYDAILAACHAADFSPFVVQEAPRLTSTISLVAAGLGVSIVPASMQRLDHQAVVYRPLSESDGLSAPIRLATLKNNRSTALRRFRETLRDVLA